MCGFLLQSLKEKDAQVHGLGRASGGSTEEVRLGWLQSADQPYCCKVGSFSPTLCPQSQYCQLLGPLRRRCLISPASLKMLQL